MHSEVSWPEESCIYLTRVVMHSGPQLPLFLYFAGPIDNEFVVNVNVH